MTAKKKIKVKRYCIYILILLSAHIFQNSIRIFPSIFGLRPVLLISAAMCVAMFEGELVGAAAGLIAGGLWDTVTAASDGYNAMFLMLSCAVCGTLVRIFLQNNIITYSIMNAASTVFYFLAYSLFFVTARGIDGAGALLLRYYLPMALYSLLLTPFWYWLIKAVNKKLSSDYMEY